MGGHREVSKWAREHSCPWEEETCAEGGHLTGVTVSAGAPLAVERVKRVFTSTECGQLEMLKWAREHYCP